MDPVVEGPVQQDAACMQQCWPWGVTCGQRTCSYAPLPSLEAVTQKMGLC